MVQKARFFEHVGCHHVILLASSASADIAFNYHLTNLI